MDVKEAVRTAKAYVMDLYSDESMGNLGLEEVEMDDATGLWRITLGFSRSWDAAQGPLAAITGNAAPRRTYKVVSMRGDGTVVSVKQREGLPA